MVNNIVLESSGFLIALKFLDKHHDRPVCCGHTIVSCVLVDNYTSREDDKGTKMLETLPPTIKPLLNTALPCSRWRTLSMSAEGRGGLPPEPGSACTGPSPWGRNSAWRTDSSSNLTTWCYSRSSPTSTCWGSC